MLRIIVLAIAMLAASASADELPLFNAKGEAVAYLNTVKRDTIYLWSGDPVAYVSGGSVYGFNGVHLGWFEDGLLWNHDGQAIGFTHAEPGSPLIAVGRGDRKPIPAKLMQDVAPIKPPFQAVPSSAMLETWLARGKAN